MEIESGIAEGFAGYSDPKGWKMSDKQKGEVFLTLTYTIVATL